MLEGAVKELSQLLHSSVLQGQVRARLQADSMNSFVLLDNEVLPRYIIIILPTQPRPWNPGLLPHCQCMHAQQIESVPIHSLAYL